MTVRRTFASNIATAVGACALACAACSFAIPDPVRSPKTGKTDCTVQRGPVQVDTVTAAVLLSLAALVTIADTGCSGSPSCDSAGFATIEIGIPTAVIGAVYGYAALDGRSVNQQCEEMQHEDHNAQPLPIYYCTTSMDDQLGSCKDTEVGCNSLRAIYQVDHVMTACEAQRTVSCFSDTRAGIDRDTCAPTAASCNALRTAVQHRLGSELSDCVERVEEKARPVSPAPVAEPPEDRRERAWQTTKAAAAAARNGDCATVVTLDVQVRSLDLEFHDTVFVRDAAIARCLAAR